MTSVSLVDWKIEPRRLSVAPQLHRVGDIAVVRDREAAVGELGEQGLDVAQRGLAGRRIADMADRGAAGELADDLVACRNCRRHGPSRGASGNACRRSW